MGATLETVNVPGICVGVAVAEVVHVHAILLQAAGALLDARQEASPVAPPLSFPVEPPGHRTAVCNTVFPPVSDGKDTVWLLWRRGGALEYLFIYSHENQFFGMNKVTFSPPD